MPENPPELAEKPFELHPDPTFTGDPANLAPKKDEPQTPAVENNLGQKIRRKVVTILEKHGVKFRKGRGRPRSDGLPGAGDIVLESNELGVPVAVAGGPAVAAAPVAGGGDPVPAGGVVPAVALSEIDQKISALFRRCLAGGARGITDGCNSITRMMAGKAGIDREFTEKTLERAKPESEAVENFAEALQLVIEKHKPEVKEGGEWYCLALAGGRLVAPYAMIWWEFKKEIDRSRAGQRAAAPGQAPGGNS